MIDSLQDQTNDSVIQKYCYNNNPANCITYGALYQWDEAMQYETTPATKGICPTGWHIPTLADFQSLTTIVNNDGNALKEVGQGTGGGAGTNTSGFSGLLAGGRSYNSYFSTLELNAYFWSSSVYSASVAWDLSLYLDNSTMNSSVLGRVYGFSVRCLKDASTGINDHSNNTLPNSIDLYQNYPNPFNPSTTISFTLSEKSRVVLSVYNELGEKVAVLFNGEQEAGMHNIEWNASKFVSGVYFYELKTEKFSSVKKLSLMK